MPTLHTENKTQQKTVEDPKLPRRHDSLEAKNQKNCTQNKWQQGKNL